MESQSNILHFLENKSILLIGATGYLAKVVLEKIIRVQPNVKKIYLLLRAADSLSASHRFKTEVMEKELFKVVKEKYGAKLSFLIEEKVSVLSGDITRDCLGLESSILEDLFGQVEIVINSAATTNFDERYDIALGINTIGATNVLNFSKKCRKLRVLLHVSTAYVCGEKEGVILEQPLKMGESLNGVAGLDIEMEKQIIQNKLQQLEAQSASKTLITSEMKELGFQRASKYGWPNSYSFTKAMGEMSLGKLKEKTPLVIIRPTIVISTLKEPFPGWIEGVKHIDSFVVGFGMGKIKSFVGHPDCILDLIPADMVVNAMVASMAAHADEPEQTIYHVGSSASNPVTIRRLQDCAVQFFTEQPWIGANGEPVVVTRVLAQLLSKDVARRYIQLHYLIPLKILWLVNAASCNSLNKTYLELSRKVKILLRLIQLFSPYIFFDRIFDETNTENLRRATEERCRVDDELFNFDPKTINWEEYFAYTHIVGVAKFAIKKR